MKQPSNHETRKVSSRFLSIISFFVINILILSTSIQGSGAIEKNLGHKSSSTLEEFASIKKKSKSNIKQYSMRMKKAHLPTAPAGGTDDYRCFLLDPKIKEDSILRSIEFIPQKKDYVHHAIMFRVSETNLPEAVEKDKSGIGWPCFGGSGLGGMFSSFVTSPWISAWAPGRGKDISPEGYGIPFKKGERLVLQIHYNLLAANGGSVETDRSRIVMEAVPANSTNVKPLSIELFAAPVELACPSGVTGPLCDRNASLRDLATRTEKSSFLEAQAIAAICGRNPAKPIPSLTTSCDRIIRSDFKIISAGPHMHLLGKKLKMTLNPGTEKEKSILNVENYDFDDQSPIVLSEPINVVSGDVIRIECVHDPALRQVLPALKFLPPRYVTWGEGSSDEMCLGVLSVTRE
jgi:hypothetical protein